MKGQLFISIFWLGFLIAISFFEAPLKFQAPSVSIEEGLDIGRIVFYWFNKVELLLLVALISFAVFSKSKSTFKIQTLLGILVLMQTFWLLPALDERAVLRISGEALDSSYHHSLFVTFELIKVFMLLRLSITIMNHKALK